MKTKVICSEVLLLLSIGLEFVYGNQSCKNHFLCMDDVCTSIHLGGCGPAKCPTLEDKECLKGRLLSLYEVEHDFCNCCPQTCLKYLKEGELCTQRVTTKFPKEICGPMLECRTTPDKEYRCQRMSPDNSQCLAKLTDYEERDIREEVGIFESPPECTEDGEYAPLQCYGTGLCNCVDKDSGEPIFGMVGSKAEALTSSMNCLCSRHHHEILKFDCRMRVNYNGGPKEQYKKDYEECLQLKRQKFFKYGGSKCLPNGNPDDIQCIHHVNNVNDICTCLEKNSFMHIEVYKPEYMVSELPCYREDYLGPCGEILKKMIKEESDKGKIWYGGITPPVCSVDGYFDAIQIHQTESNIHICTDRNGEQIENFQADSSVAKNAMHCRCALARKYLDPRLGIPKCCTNGNYECRQCQKGQCYCVDQYGRQVGLEVNQVDSNNLNCDNCCSEIGL